MKWKQYGTFRLISCLVFDVTNFIDSAVSLLENRYKRKLGKGVEWLRFVLCILTWVRVSDKIHFYQNPESFRKPPNPPWAANFLNFFALWAVRNGQQLTGEILEISVEVRRELKVQKKKMQITIGKYLCDGSNLFEKSKKKSNNEDFHQWRFLS